ncbi:MAG: hypothetical protein Q9159_002442 [Coniocarpon cinnabarinum]
MAQAHTSRPRQKPLGNEEAGATLNLGEFSGDYALSNSEARLLLTVLTEKQRNVNPNFRESETLARTMDHLDAFARIKQATIVTQLETVLKNAPNLTTFEKSQLGSLCCVDVDEAKTLVPSIATKLTDDEILNLLNQLTDLQRESERESFN